MSLTERTRIKICGLTRECDVDAAVAAGVDAIGLVLYNQSPRHVTVARAAELARRLPPFVTPVLLFVNHSASEIIAAHAGVTGATAQFHGDETASQCQHSADLAHCHWLRAARIPMGPSGGSFDLLKFVENHSRAHGIVLDALVDGYGGSGQTFDWSLLPAYVDAHLILSGGLDADNVTAGLLQLRSRCKTLSVDVSTGVEVAGHKGIKDHDKINRFVAAVRAADQIHSITHHV